MEVTRTLSRAGLLSWVLPTGAAHGCCPSPAHPLITCPSHVFHSPQPEPVRTSHIPHLSPTWLRPFTPLHLLSISLHFTVPNFATLDAPFSPVQVKAEIQALSSFGFQYLSQVYLPLKLQEGDWI